MKSRALMIAVALVGCAAASPALADGPRHRGADSHWRGGQHHAWTGKRGPWRHDAASQRHGPRDVWAPSLVIRDSGARAPIAPPRVVEWELELPTRADLPQFSGYHSAPTAPPDVFVINDESHGRSGKAGGARVYAKARVATLGEGFAGAGPGTARIIVLQAR